MFDIIDAWIAVGGLSLAGLLAVAWFFPPFRKIALQAAAVIGAAMFIYGKGAANARKKEKEKRDAAVAKAQADYSKIDARPDDAGTVNKRLRDGSF